MRGALFCRLEVTLACLMSLALLPLASAQTVELRLLETTDIHTNIVPYDYYQDAETDAFGLAKTATLIKAARNEAPNSLLFDNGDLIQGTPLGDYKAKIDVLEPYLSRLIPVQPRGRKRSYKLRVLINAVRYVLRNGCTWRDLPGDFLPAG